MTTFVRNIVFACPGSTYDEYLREGRALAEFYAALLDMRVIREDWIKIAKDPDSTPQLAFGDGPGEYTPPEWGNPERPQQMHIDIAVPDLRATRDLVTSGGATMLQDWDIAAAYADPAGHPFCVYAADVDGPRVGRIVIDCPSPRELAPFYEQLFGMTRTEDTSELVEISGDDPAAPAFAFQRSDDPPPRWPDPGVPAAGAPRHLLRRCACGARARGPARRDTASRDGRQRSGVRRSGVTSVLSLRAGSVTVIRRTARRGTPRARRGRS